MSDFERGVKLGNEAETVFIAINDCWSAKLKNGGNITSYEKIGFHAGSVEFLNGVLSTGVSVVRCIDENGKICRWPITSNPWRDAA